MSTAFICDAVRTPIGRYGGGLSSVRTDDLGAIPIRTLIERVEELNKKVEKLQTLDLEFEDTIDFGLEGTHK